MSEIKKMYSNANIKICKRKQGFTLKDCTDRDCKKCGYYDIPPFTSEKQLLLLQWLLDKTDLYLHRHKTDFTYSIASGKFAVNKYKDFRESIAEFINTIWQDLPEEERNDISGILRT